MYLKDLKTSDGQCLDFMHGYCDYFALGVASEYGCKVGLWLDVDDETGADVLVHAFVVLGDCLYFDNKGFFTSISERADDFECNYTPNVFIVELEKAKSILKNIHISCTKALIKRYVREYLRHIWIVLDLLFLDAADRKVVYLMEYNDSSQIRKIQFSSLSNHLKVSDYVSTFSVSQFMDAKKHNCTLIPREKV